MAGKKNAKETAKTTKKKVGRPKKIIDKRQFEELCKIQCTRSEIANVFDCDEDTVNEWCKREYGVNFSVVLNKKADSGKMSLRRIQYNMAEAGSERMAIWLGKQWLGQTDKQDVTVAEIDESHRNEIEEFLNDPGTNTDPAES